MPELKTKMIFISHAWAYNEHYYTLEKWFNEEPNFSWKNCSVPSHDGLADKTSKGLSEGMTRQIAPAQIVLVLGGMYAAYSSWIDYEIKEAQRMGKTIIGIRPWGQERIPQIVQDASVCDLIGWNRSSIIQAIRDWT
jgi:predicted molibdopterin-dependent oxidoreductase YjgC